VTSTSVKLRASSVSIEVAAVTAGIMALGASDVIPLRVEVNCPFLFFIVDRASGAFLFAGRVIEPKE